MNIKRLIIIINSILIVGCTNTNTNSTDINKEKSKFNIECDLLLVQFDSKTDVDDLQTAAALYTLLSCSVYSNLQYHAVAGTYGIQEGLYVPPNELFQLAFGNNWTDCHQDANRAAEKVKSIIKTTLLSNGSIWIAEAGQSDFTTRLIELIHLELPNIETKKRIHVIQHSTWNENSTNPKKLQFVKLNTDYWKIADGNIIGNGTPGFCSETFTQWRNYIKSPKMVEVWKCAFNLSNKYNGLDGRYKNKAVASGGVDFSDFSEVCWILGLETLKDAEHFFSIYSK